MSFFLSKCTFRPVERFNEIIEKIEQEFAPDIEEKKAIVYKTVSKGLNMRDCNYIDNTECPVIIEIPKGERVRIIDTTYNHEGKLWYKAEYRGNVGYCSGHSNYWN